MDDVPELNKKPGCNVQVSVKQTEKGTKNNYGDNCGLAVQPSRSWHVAGRSQERQWWLTSQQPRRRQ